MSAPAEKARSPAPRSTITRVSAATCSTARAIVSATSAPITFNGGLSSQTVVIAASATAGRLVGVSTTRLETFADGVFAIAATLLIIDVTADAHGSALGDELAHAWPQYLAYAVSFLTISIMWLNHHMCLELIDRADRRFLVFNVALLACIAFVPFPTRLVA